MVRIIHLAVLSVVFFFPLQMVFANNHGFGTIFPIGGVREEASSADQNLFGKTVPIGGVLEETFSKGRFFGGGNQGGVKLENPVAFKSLGALIAAILDVIVQIAVPIAALFLMYSGFLFVSARGDEAQLKTAKSIFLWTIVGIAVLLGAKILAGVIEGTINQIKGGR